jgi:hypothetical protein
MKKILLSVLGVAGGVLLLTLPNRQTFVPEAPASGNSLPGWSADSAAVSLPTVAPDAETPDSTLVATAQPQPETFGAWAMEVPREPDMAKIVQFKDWLKRWNAAEPDNREGISAEGTQLARERRPEFKALIAKDPRRALEESVPRVIRQDLPRVIVEHLERPVSATGITMSTSVGLRPVRRCRPKVSPSATSSPAMA